MTWRGHYLLLWPETLVPPLVFEPPQVLLGQFGDMLQSMALDLFLIVADLGDLGVAEEVEG